MRILEWLFPSIFSEECNEGYVITARFHVKDGSSYHNRVDEALEDSIMVLANDMQIEPESLVVTKGKILSGRELFFFNLFVFLAMGLLLFAGMTIFEWIL